MHSRSVQLLIMLLISMGLASCGLMIPDIKESWDKDVPADPVTATPKITGAAQMEWEIRRRVYCELKEAVRSVNQLLLAQRTGKNVKGADKSGGPIPLNWEAQVSLSLEVDESSSINPGLALNTPLPNTINYPAKTTALGAVPAVITPQSFSLGVGGTLSSTATRIDTYNPYYSVAALMKPTTGESVCVPENDPFTRASLKPVTSSPLIIVGDLGIQDWLTGAMLNNVLLPSIGGSTGKPPVTYEVKFIIVSSGNVTPTWKLVRVSANAGALSFISTGRTRTHDLIVTIGPPGAATNNNHLAAQIGSAVSNGNRATVS
jgi:hypothetical protein